MTTANSDIHDLTDSSASRGTEERAYPPNKFAATGSTGLVGRHLVVEFIRSGFS